MKCPKCRHVNLYGAKECDACGVQFADVKGRGAEIDITCPWNDHGDTCGQRGSLSDGLNGQGPWYCSTHWAKLKGWPLSKNTEKPPSFRERWYAERGLSYEAPKLEDAGHFVCVGGKATELLDRLRDGHLGAKRMRQPGEDSPEDIGEEV